MLLYVRHGVFELEVDKQPASLCCVDQSDHPAYRLWNRTKSLLYEQRLGTFSLTL